MVESKSVVLLSVKDVVVVLEGSELVLPSDALCVLDLSLREADVSADEENVVSRKELWVLLGSDEDRALPDASVDDKLGPCENELLSDIIVYEELGIDKPVCIVLVKKVLLEVSNGWVPEAVVDESELLIGGSCELESVEDEEGPELTETVRDATPLLDDRLLEDTSDELLSIVEFRRDPEVCELELVSGVLIDNDVLKVCKDDRGVVVGEKMVELVDDKSAPLETAVDG